TVDGSSSISSFHSNSRFSIASSMVDLTSIRLLAQINKSFCFVGLNVVLENQIRVALAKFLERPPLTLGRVAVKTKPVIEYQNCSFLEKVFGKIQRAGCGGIEIAIYVNNGSFCMQQ